MTNPYSADQIRAAFEATVAFFRANPEKRLQKAMSNGTHGTPFDRDADCFCFAGYLARELGPLPNADGLRETRGYAPGYSELDAIQPDLSFEVYGINDRTETTEEVLEAERALLTEKGLI